MKKALFAIPLIALVLLMASSGWLLVRNAPEHADAIIVLAGETEVRPQRALQLLDQGYAPRLIIDIPTGGKIYDWTVTELALRYVQSLPERQAVTICPVDTFSTKDESAEALQCASQLSAKRILLVTSDFHTHRALDIFRHRGKASGYSFSVAAAYDPRVFGAPWWTHREWAKTNLNESTKFLWWEVVDRWR